MIGSFGQSGRQAISEQLIVLLNQPYPNAATLRCGGCCAGADIALFPGYRRNRGRSLAALRRTGLFVVKLEEVRRGEAAGRNVTPSPVAAHANALKRQCRAANCPQDRQLDRSFRAALRSNAARVIGVDPPSAFVGNGTQMQADGTTQPTTPLATGAMAPC
jgi:hypothetical protein